MMFGLLRALARIRVTVAYAVILTGVSSVLVALGPRVQNRVISRASTNLHNLSHGHLGTLFVSAFVIEAGPIYVWLPGLMCLLALAELMWRSRRLVVAFAIGHIGATLLVAVGLTAAVELGWLSTDVTRATDVGHGMALVLGVLASTRFGHAASWTPTRCLLLLVASAFGFLMLANNTPTLIAASGLGVVGAALAQAVVWRRPARQPASGSAAERAPTLHVTPLSVPDHL